MRIFRKGYDMKEIELMEHVLDEIRDAHNYVKMAIEYKDCYSKTAELLYKLSGEEMEHANELHKNVVWMMDERRKVGELPADDAAVYEYLHRHAIDKSGDVGVLQGMYRR